MGMGGGVVWNESETIRSEEIRSALRMIKGGNAAGMDGIAVECIYEIARVSERGHVL